MWWLINLGIMVAGYFLQQQIANYQRARFRPPGPGPFNLPETATGTVIPVLYGTFRMRGVTTDLMEAKLVEKTGSVSTILGQENQHLFWTYKVSMEQILTWGQVNVVANIIFGDKFSLADQDVSTVQTVLVGTKQVIHTRALIGRLFVSGCGYTGPHADSIEVYGGGRAEMYVFLPNIYGGPQNGGGFTAIGGDANEAYGGSLIFYLGSKQTGPDAIQEKFHGVGEVPDYNDFCRLIYNDVNIGEASTPNPIDIIAYREPRPEYIIPGGSGSPAVNARCITGRKWNWSAIDLNAAAIIYDMLRNEVYGHGEPAHMLVGGGLADGCFEAAQRTLVSEGIGVSCYFNADPQKTQDVIDKLLEIADAVLIRDPVTFQRKIRLIRNEAETNTQYANLRTIDQNSIAELQNWSRMEWSETFNVVTVKFSDAERFYRENTVTVFNDANIAQTGEEREITIDYPWVTDISVARSLAARELKKLSQRLWRGKAKITRTAWDYERGDVLKMDFSPKGISGLVIRVMGVDLGDETDEYVIADIMQDAFAFDSIRFASEPPPPILYLPNVIKPTIINLAQTVNSTTGTVSFQLVDPENRTFDISYRTLVGVSNIFSLAPWSAWTSVASATPNSGDPAFPYNPPVCDADLQGVYTFTVPLASTGPSYIEFKISSVGYADPLNPTANPDLIDQTLTFDQLAAPTGTSQVLTDGDPIVWDVTGKMNDQATVTVMGSRHLIILGAVKGFHGVLIVTEGVGGLTLTLPPGSIMNGGGSTTVTLGVKTYLTVDYDGTFYWWNLVANPASLPPIPLDASLSVNVSVTATLGSDFGASLSVSITPTSSVVLSL